MELLQLNLQKDQFEQFVSSNIWSQFALKLVGKLWCNWKNKIHLWPLTSQRMQHISTTWITAFTELLGTAGYCVNCRGICTSLDVGKPNLK